jgi:hypothetical protein
MKLPKIEVGIIKTKSSGRKPVGGTSPKNLMNKSYTGIGKMKKITDTINTHAMNLFIFIFCPLVYFDPFLNFRSMPAFVAWSWMAERTILAFALISLSRIWAATTLFCAWLMAFVIKAGGIKAVEMQKKLHERPSL